MSLFKSSEKGNILVSSLLILVVMNLLAAGLVTISVQESNIATYKTIDSTLLHVTESCTKSAINWLKDKDSPEPTTSFPHNITANDLSSIMTGNESEAALRKLSDYNYGCTITYITMQYVGGSAESGEGEEVGTGSGYSSNNASNIRYYYRIESTGNGPKNSTKTTNTIVSVKY